MEEGQNENDRICHCCAQNSTHRVISFARTSVDAFPMPLHDISKTIDQKLQSQFDR